MATVNVSLTLKKQTVPVTPSASSTLRFQLLKDGAVAAQVDVALPDTAVSFANVVDGTYTVSAQRLSNVNQAIGDVAVSQPFTVVNTVDIDVPDVVSVAL